MDWSQGIVTAAIAFASASVGAWVGGAASRAAAREQEQATALIRLHQAFLDDEIPLQPYVLVHDARALERLRLFASQSDIEPVRGVIAALVQEERWLRERSEGLPDPNSAEWDWMKSMLSALERLVSEEVYERVTLGNSARGWWKRLLPRPKRQPPLPDRQ